MIEYLTSCLKKYESRFFEKLPELHTALFSEIEKIPDNSNQINYSELLKNLRVFKKIISVFLEKEFENEMEGIFSKLIKLFGFLNLVENISHDEKMLKKIENKAVKIMYHMVVGQKKKEMIWKFVVTILNLLKNANALAFDVISSSFL